MLFSRATRQRQSGVGPDVLDAHREPKRAQDLLRSVSHIRGQGRARQLCAGTSGLDFLGDLDGVVNLDAKIACSARPWCLAVDGTIGYAADPSPRVRTIPHEPAEHVRASLIRGASRALTASLNVAGSSEGDFPGI